MHNNSLQSNPFNWCLKSSFFHYWKLGHWIVIWVFIIFFFILWCFVVILIRYDANLKFTVLDQNDNKPIFSQGSYTFTGKHVSRTCAWILNGACCYWWLRISSFIEYHHWYYHRHYDHVHSYQYPVNIPSARNGTCRANRLHRRLSCRQRLGNKLTGWRNFLNDNF